MKERPILFSAPMVRAILDGRKTQTRRVVKPQPYVDAQGNACWNGTNFGQDASGPHIQALASPLPSSKTGRVRCPFGKPGDRLWVRETWGYRCTAWNGAKPNTHTHSIEYKADGARIDFDKELGDHSGLPKQRKCRTDEDYQEYYSDYLTRYWKAWRPSIHMPRWASRILLEITGVRVERLADISEEDAAAEGIYNDGDVIPFNGPWFVEPHDTQGYSKASDCYCALWEKINGAGSWMTNPWGWVIAFKRVTP